MTTLIVAVVAFLSGMVFEWLVGEAVGVARGNEDIDELLQKVSRHIPWRPVAIVLVLTAMAASLFSAWRLQDAYDRIDSLSACQRQTTQYNIDLWRDVRDLIGAGPSSPSQTALLESIDVYIVALAKLQDLRADVPAECQT